MNDASPLPTSPEIERLLALPLGAESWQGWAAELRAAQYMADVKFMGDGPEWPKRAILTLISEIQRLEALLTKAKADNALLRQTWISF